MATVIDKALEKIKRERIAPESRMTVLFRRSGHWAVGAGVILLSALALAAGYELILDLDWDITERRSIRRILFLFGSLPYFWIAVTVALSALAIFAVRKTDKGYRLSRLSLIGGVAAVIVLSGILFVSGHAGLRMHDSFRQEMPFYDRLVGTKEDRWSRPKDGFLGGTIVLVREGGFELTGFREEAERYFIVITRETDLAPSVRVAVGEKVRVIGRRESDERFVAEFVRPFSRPGYEKHPGMMPMRVSPGRPSIDRAP